ncbi:MAG: HAMP domain-containing protein [Bdellovibrionaceae bacterium]|nr:HAMP domain-containing protein [Bdellovibrionales bacterium]MCB9084237.1 HAMP domain-containing protein [Pseudobdellovibrionaceae bacterium]
MRIPISIKLVVLTLIIILGVAGAIAFKSTDLFEKITISRENDSNRGQAGARATEVENLLIGYVDKVKMVASLLHKEYTSKEEKEKALFLTFRQDRDLISLEVWSRGGQKPLDRVVNDEYLKQYKLGADYIDRVRTHQRRSQRLNMAAVFAGEVELRNSTLEGGAPLVTLALPFVADDYGNITHIALADIRLDRLQKVFGRVSERLLYLVDREGFLLAHPDEKQVFGNVTKAEVPIVREALRSQLKQGQLRFLSEKGEAFTGAFARTSMGVTVISQASEEVILEAAKSVRREAFRITGQSLSIALFVVFLLSLTLTAPIEKLVDLTHAIAAGNFNVRSNVRSLDEVGQLASAFDEMVSGLQERDKVKNLLNKFHGSSVADDLMKGDLHLGGSRKDVTVFFSDIRGFTKFSEGHTPEEVVDMLNEYFQIMVGIINRHGGVVDKFIGDAIMAVWGAPNPSDRDPFNAVKACMEMREALDKLNQTRGERGQVPIKMGIGLHCGSVISGTIGSDERMEYTVIGDTVNQASRIEASTKAFGTDLLLSNEIAEIVKGEFIVEEAGKVEVKGKSDALKLHKVRGYVDESGKEVRVQTQYSDYEAEGADKVKIA